MPREAKKKDTCNTITREKARGQCKEQENLSRKNWIGKYKDNNFETSPGQDYAKEQASKFREQVKKGVMVMNEMVVQKQDEIPSMGNNNKGQGARVVELKRMFEEMRARPRITSIARKEVMLVTEKGVDTNNKQMDDKGAQVRKVIKVGRKRLGSKGEKGQVQATIQEFLVRMKVSNSSNEQLIEKGGQVNAKRKVMEDVHMSVRSASKKGRRK